MAIDPKANDPLTEDSGAGRLIHERSIFRPEAREKYIENQDKVVLPRLLSKKLVAVLWIVALLLMVSGSIIIFWPFIEQLRMG